MIYKIRIEKKEIERFCNANRVSVTFSFNSFTIKFKNGSIDIYAKDIKDITFTNYSDYILLISDNCDSLRQLEDKFYNQLEEVINKNK